MVAGWAVVVSTPEGRQGPRKDSRHPRRPCIPVVRILGSWRAPPATAVTRRAPPAARAASKSNYLRGYLCYLNRKEVSNGSIQPFGRYSYQGEINDHRKWAAAQNFR